MTTTDSTIALPAPVRPVPVQRWEYFVAHFKSGTSWDEIQAYLNGAGYDGWELVNADVERNQRVVGSPMSVACFLKRQRAL